MEPLRTSEPVSEQSPPLARKNPWPTVVVILGIVALGVGGAVFVAREIVRAPAGLIEKTGGLIDKGGARLRDVAAAFQQGTVHTEFLSQAAEITGTSRFQFATLKQAESFKREESGSTAWGWIPLPKVVVLAVAPVEYGYFLDFAAPWEFQREGNGVTVFPPPITPSTPAIDVSALTFYTLEGGLWRDEGATKEKLRQSLTESLKTRSEQNATLVREVGRQRLAAFVEKWLAEKFSDGGQFHVKVVFPDERVASPDPKSL
ncbi:MAG: hypothetical protein WCF18_14195 [Chthoniobacteraceae bacterium]